MRAVAVLAVLVYHIWPAVLPGGYVGVDVFFVISGYLITGLLVREFERSGTISLRDFYARRIRRLLPAASATLLAVAAAAWAWSSASEWGDLARELVASALYVENWLLVQRSVDYLAQDAAPSPVQHFWSLSVEEQFYIFWPLLMLGVGALARGRGWPVRKAFLVSLGVVSLASLGYGVYVSFVDPAPGYFLTTTRIWELGVGGLLAIASGAEASGSSRWVRAGLGWVGMAAIAVACVFYSSRLPFPGYEALLPTLGAVALLYSRSGPGTGLGALLSSRPMQYFGDISYSLYLWHWPIVVFYPLVTGREVATFQDGMAVAAVSVLVAHVSKQFIEERFRHGRQGESLRPYAIGAGLTAVLAVSAGGLVFSGNRIAQQAQHEPEDLATHPGALAWSGHEVPAGIPVLPSPDVARMDRPKLEGSGERCIGTIESTDVTPCTLGDPEGSATIALVGDSHAEHWIPAFDAAAKRMGWKLSVFSKMGCAFTDVPIQSGNQRTGLSPYPECLEWSAKLVGELGRIKPALVVVSQSPNHRVEGNSPRGSQRSIAEGVLRRLEALKAQGVRTAVLKHTPWLPVSGPECVKSGGACVFPSADVLPQAALNIAATMDPGLAVMDMTPSVCREGRCPVVVGNVLVYRDQHHLTATYARTMGQDVEREIQRIVKDGR
jgi:peptidoglycan/LPS O-acetylase OafA/YrhL